MCEDVEQTPAEHTHDTHLKRQFHGVFGVVQIVQQHGVAAHVDGDGVLGASGAAAQAAVRLLGRKLNVQGLVLELRLVGGVARFVAAAMWATSVLQAQTHSHTAIQTQTIAAGTQTRTSSCTHAQRSRETEKRRNREPERVRHTHTHT